MKRIICMILGHPLERESIINTICSNNWLRKCKRCGRYIIHGDLGSICISEKKAMKIKSEFEKEFPYSIKKEGAV